jgi:hypothetical protein
MRTHAANKLEELETGRPEQVVLRPLLHREIKDRTKQVVLDQEPIVEVVVLGDTRAEEPQRGETEVFVAGAEQLGDIGRNRRRQDKILGSERVVRDEEA